MNEITTADAIAWFEKRKATITMSGARSMYGKAIVALQAQAEAEKNDPLTLDELRKMDGEPVFVVPKEKNDGELGPRWCVICVQGQYSCAEIPCIDYWTYDFETYGVEWLAYRHKPEEGAK